MKKIFITMLLVTSAVAFGQQEGRQKRMASNFTPEQQAILKTKQMTLQLDLNDSQQKQMLKLNKKWAAEKAAKKASMQSVNKEEMSQTDKFNHMNEMLDKKIEHQNEVKKILNEDQYTAWKKSMAKMKQRSKGRMQGGQKSQRGGPQR